MFALKTNHVHRQTFFFHERDVFVNAFLIDKFIGIATDESEFFIVKIRPKKVDNQGLRAKYRPKK